MEACSFAVPFMWLYKMQYMEHICVSLCNTPIKIEYLRISLYFYIFCSRAYQIFFGKHQTKLR